jgi:hypothetical protein
MAPDKFSGHPRQFSTTAAVANRTSELGLTVDDLAERAGVSHGTVRRFGLSHHSTAELERLSVALGWPAGHLAELWGDQPGG